MLLKSQYQRLRIGRLAVEEMAPKEQKQLLKRKVEVKWLPFPDPYWMDVRQTFKSPNFKPKHSAFANKIRKIFAEEVAPQAAMWDETGKFPHREVAKKLYDLGVYSSCWPEKYGGTPPEGGWDYYMDFMLQYELVRVGSGGVSASLFGSIGIGLPPVLQHGSDDLKQRIAVPVIKAEKHIALLITEPWAGSDVARIRCSAVDNGDHWVVSGEKKFITGGMTADFFTTAVRTDPTAKGMAGISLLVIPADAEGVERKRMKTQGWWASSTAYITFDNVKVPKANCIGQPGKGFLYVMENFAHERFTMICGIVSACHAIIGLCTVHARNRHTFNQRLVDSQVIRAKLAQMVMRTEACFALTESLTHMLAQGVPQIDIAPRITLAKTVATQTLEFVAREASQIFGGYSYQRGGAGEAIERVYRDVRVNAIAGGSEEIMMDFAMRGSKI